MQVLEELDAVLLQFVAQLAHVIDLERHVIDLPVIGLKTLEGAARAGLAGIAVEARGALVVRRGELIAAADRAGLFLFGFEPGDVGEA